jgi:cysteine desulfurase / selenocysteine lyase
MTTAKTICSSWRDTWFPTDGAVYLNAAGQAAMPRVALEAVQRSLEWKKFPYTMTDAGELDLPRRVRASIASLIGANPEEIAVTTGASSGLIALAYSMTWNRGDEILTAYREFPLQYTTWRPMEQREGVTLKVITPKERWITADDFIAALTPKTRLVSASLVRFDDGSMLDAAKLGAACRAQGIVLALDVSQSCGAIPMNVSESGVDFITCSGYKWLLGPYGTGFFWASRGLLGRLRPGPYYWQGIDGLRNYDALIFENPKAASGARPWDASETASYFNLAGWDASLNFLKLVRIETVAVHNQALITKLHDCLPAHNCVWTSPADPAHRGPYGCFAGHSAEQTHALYQRMKEEKIYASLREGNIRVSTHLYNTEDDIDKLIDVVSR